jgi:ribosomal protein L21E
LPDLLADREATLEFLKANLATARNRMKLKADKNIIKKEFQAGDKVLLKLQPCVQQSVVSQP